MELVTVKTKFQVVIPQSIRKQVRLDIGDLLEASLENGKIVFTPKTVIDRHPSEGMEDIAQGWKAEQETQETEMKVRFTERADEDHATLLPEVRKRRGKQHLASPGQTAVGDSTL